MRNAIQLLGIVLVLQGVSGAIDHLAVQPFFGPLLNFFNRFILPRVDALAGYELLANLGLAALGAMVVIAAGWRQPS
jgi:hypothetical protein